MLSDLQLVNSEWADGSVLLTALALRLQIGRYIFSCTENNSLGILSINGRENSMYMFDNLLILCNYLHGIIIHINFNLTLFISKFRNNVNKIHNRFDFQINKLKCSINEQIFS